MLKKKFKGIFSRCIRVFLCVVLMIGIPQTVSADDADQQELYKPQRLNEVTQLRDNNSTTYRLADGSYEWVGCSEDINYIDNKGAYQQIKNDIIVEKLTTDNTNYAFKNKANRFDLRFASNSAQPYMARLDYKGKTVEFGLPDAKASDAAIMETTKNKALSTMIDVAGCIEYKNVYENIDFVYQSKTYGVKEYIILNQPTDKNEFCFNLKLGGLTAKEIDGGVAFVDKSGNSIFELGDLFAVDSKGEISKDVKCVIVDSDDLTHLKITVDKDYLADKERVYPIVIDPEIMITGSSVTKDTFISSRYPSKNYYLNERLRTGKDNDYYVRRTLIKFDLPSLPAGSVTSAFMRIKKQGGVDPTTVIPYVVTENWTSSTATWNNQPDIYGSGGMAYHDSGSWWRMNVTSVVSNWVNGASTNRGFMLKDSVETNPDRWTTFYSSDAPSPNKPELHIVYTPPVDITSVEPLSGYLLQGNQYTLKAWVTGGGSPTVTYKYPSTYTKLSTTLNYGSSYYSKNITPTSENFAYGTYSSGAWFSQNGTFTAASSGGNDTYTSYTFICGGTYDFYDSCDSTFYYNSPTDNSFRGVSPGGNQYRYNCLAYSVDVNNDWFWPFSYEVTLPNGSPWLEDRNPTYDELCDFMTKDPSGEYADRAGTAYSPCSANSTPNVIYYSDLPWDTTDCDGHFGKVIAWNTGGYPTAIYSKWGDYELIYSSSAAPFIAGGGYPSNIKAYFG